MSLVAELRRRKVPQAVGLYLAVGFGAVEVLTYLVESLRPEWADTSRFVLAAIYLIGLPAAVYLPWAYDYQQGRLRPVPAEKEVSRSALAGFVVTLAILELALAGAIFWPRDAVTHRRDAARGAPVNALAVLPFTDTSASSENAGFLAVGLHDELLTTLSRIDGLDVISRTSTDRYRDSDKSLRQIGEELGVNAILEGGVQRAGDRVRVNVQLIDAGSDRHLWAERYDREITTDSLFGIQSDIAVAIARSLRAALTAQERADLARLPTESLEAYQAYLLGRQRMTPRNVGGIREAASHFRRTIELDPDFAPAYVGLADTYILQGEYGGLARAEMTTRAMPLLEKALALDGRLASAYTSLGAVRSKNDDTSGAETAFRQAIDLDHNNSTAFHWYGDVLLVNRAQPEAALPLLGRARQLDPLSPAVIATYGRALEALGRFEEARAQYQKILEIDPASPIGYSMMGEFERLVSGRLDEAVRWYRQGIVHDPGNAALMGGLALCYLDLGDVGEATVWAGRAVARGPDQYWALVVAMLLNLRQEHRLDALELADQLQVALLRDNFSLAAHVYLGEYREAIDVYADRYPELSCSGDVEVGRQNVFQAINLSLAREQTGEADCAQRMLEGALSVLSHMPRFGSMGYGIADVEVQVRLGRIDGALAALRAAVDSGWRANWWLQGGRSPHLAALRDEPRFRAMMAEVEADVAAQLARLRQAEQDGKSAAVRGL